jgi:SAM-dependent methyltransferase
MPRGSGQRKGPEAPPQASEFRPDQYEIIYPDGVENHWWHIARSRILASEILRSVGPASAVLDVGCGRGVTVKHLRARGIDCTGADLAKPRPLAGLEPYLQLGMDAVDLPPHVRRRVDVILLLDVIEHIQEPAAFLRSLAGAFDRLAQVIVTVPARPEVWSNYDEFYGHHRRYTLPMIDELAHELGWAVADRGYFFRAT